MADDEDPLGMASPANLGNDPSPRLMQWGPVEKFGAVAPGVKQDHAIPGPPIRPWTPQRSPGPQVQPLTFQSNSESYPRAMQATPAVQSLAFQGNPESYPHALQGNTGRTVQPLPFQGISESHPHALQGNTGRTVQSLAFQGISESHPHALQGNTGLAVQTLPHQGEPKSYPSVGHQNFGVLPPSSHNVPGHVMPSHQRQGSFSSHFVPDGSSPLQQSAQQNSSVPAPSWQPSDAVPPAPCPSVDNPKCQDPATSSSIPSSADMKDEPLGSSVTVSEEGVVDMWRAVCNAKGFPTDTDLAKYLLSLYMNSDDPGAGSVATCALTAGRRQTVSKTEGPSSWREGSTQTDGRTDGYFSSPEASTQTDCQTDKRSSQESKPQPVGAQCSKCSRALTLVCTKCQRSSVESEEAAAASGAARITRRSSKEVSPSLLSPQPGLSSDRPRRQSRSSRVVVKRSTLSASSSTDVRSVTCLGSGDGMDVEDLTGLEAESDAEDSGRDTVTSEDHPPTLMTPRLTQSKKRLRRSQEPQLPTHSVDSTLCPIVKLHRCDSPELLSTEQTLSARSASVNAASKWRPGPSIRSGAIKPALKLKEARCAADDTDKTEDKLDIADNMIKTEDKLDTSDNANKTGDKLDPAERITRKRRSESSFAATVSTEDTHVNREQAGVPSTKGRRCVEDTKRQCKFLSLKSAAHSRVENAKRHRRLLTQKSAAQSRGEDAKRHRRLLSQRNAAQKTSSPQATPAAEKGGRCRVLSNTDEDEDTMRKRRSLKPESAPQAVVSHYSTRSSGPLVKAPKEEPVTTKTGKYPIVDGVAFKNGSIPFFKPFQEFRCSRCDKTFPKRNNMIRHIKNPSCDDGNDDVFQKPRETRDYPKPSTGEEDWMPKTPRKPGDSDVKSFYPKRPEHATRLKGITLEEFMAGKVQIPISKKVGGSACNRTTWCYSHFTCFKCFTIFDVEQNFLNHKEECTGMRDSQQRGTDVESVAASDSQGSEDNQGVGDADVRGTKNVATVAADKQDIKNVETVAADKQGIENADTVAADKQGIENVDMITADKQGIENVDMVAADKQGIANVDMITADIQGIENVDMVAADKQGIENVDMITADKHGTENADIVTADKKSTENADMVAADKKITFKADVVAADKKVTDKADMVAADKKITDKADMVAADKKITDKADVVAADIPGTKGADEEATADSGDVEGGVQTSADSQTTKRGADRASSADHRPPRSSKKAKKKTTFDAKSIEILKRVKERYLLCCPHCDIMYFDKEQLALHLLSHFYTEDAAGVYTCKLCYGVFQKLAHIHQHMKFVVQKKSSSCKECGLSYESRCQVDEHTRMHRREGKSLKAQGPKRPRKNTLSAMCPICGKGFPGRCSLEVHVKSHSGNKPYSCCVCGQAFMNKKSFIRHKGLHEGAQFQREVGGKEFFTQTTLGNHVKGKRSLNQKPEFCCESCGKKLGSKHQLETHADNVHGLKLQCCRVCSYVTEGKARLKEHMRTHTGEKPYQCGNCPSKFARSDYLRKHMRLHTGERPYKCDNCPQRFVCATTLKHHSLRHHRDKMIPCEVCVKSFYTRNSLAYHKYAEHGTEYPNMLVHVNVKDKKIFPCDLCSKILHTSAGLDFHRKRHYNSRQESSDKKPAVSQLGPAAIIAATGNDREETTATENDTGDIAATGNDTGLITATGNETGEITATGNDLKVIAATRNNARKISATRKVFPCDLCSKILDTSAGLDFHRKRHRGSRQKISGKKPSVSRLSPAASVHVNSFLTVPTGNDAGDIAAKKLDTGEITATGKIFPCDLCGKILETSAGLDFHRKRHRGRRQKISGKKPSVSRLSPAASVHANSFLTVPTENDAGDIASKNLNTGEITATKNTTGEIAAIGNHTGEITATGNDLKEIAAAGNKAGEIAATGKIFPCDLCSKILHTSAGLDFHRKRHRDSRQKSSDKKPNVSRLAPSASVHANSSLIVPTENDAGYIAATKTDTGKVKVTRTVTRENAAIGNDMGEIAAPGNKSGEITVTGNNRGEIAATGNDTGDIAASGNDTGDIAASGNNTGEIAATGNDKGELACLCEVCAECFSSESSLQTHMQNHRLSGSSH